MSAYSDHAVQEALYYILTTTSAVTDLLSEGEGGVHDHVPEAAGFPYIVISALSSKPLDTVAVLGRDLLAGVDVYSRMPGFAETRGIMDAVHTALHNAGFSLSGQTMVMCLEVSSSETLGSDGKTRHGKMEFRIVTEEAG